MMNGDDAKYSKYTRYALNRSIKDGIKEAVGNICEHCKGHFETEVLVVHHISPVHKADGRYDLNDPHNLVVLCPTCHTRVEKGLLHTVEMIKIVSGREEQVKNDLDNILKDRNLVITPKKDTAGSPGNTVVAVPGSAHEYTDDGAYRSSYSSHLSVGYAVHVLFLSGTFTMIFFVALYGWLMTGIKNWLVTTINPGGLSIAITEAILNLILIVFFIFVSGLMALAIKTIIKKLEHKKPFGFIYENPALRDFILAGNRFVIVLSLAVFILIAFLPTGVSSQVYAGENGLFRNLFFSVISSFLDIWINVSTFTTALVTLYAVSTMIAVLAIGPSKIRY